MRASATGPASRAD